MPSSGVHQLTDPSCPRPYIRSSMRQASPDTGKVPCGTEIPATKWGSGRRKKPNRNRDDARSRREQKRNKTDSSLERQKKVLRSRNKNRRPQEGLCGQFELLEITSVIAEMFKKKSVVELEHNVKRAMRRKKAW